MTGPFEVWRRNLWSWAVPLAVCIVGLAGLAIYYSAFEGRVPVLEKAYEQRLERLESYRNEAAEIADLLTRIENQRQQVAVLYSDHFQTEDERFTRAITEVKRLARNAGLQPTSFSYPTTSEGPGLIRRNINFGVDGTYRQLRTFINLLELSDQFLTLESITLSGSSEAGNQEPRLSIGLRLATFFVPSSVVERLEDDVASVDEITARAVTEVNVAENDRVSQSGPSASDDEESEE